MKALSTSSLLTTPREVTRAGEAYYWPAGHTARMDEATAFLEIGPVKEMRQFSFSEHAKAKFS